MSETKTLALDATPQPAEAAARCYDCCHEDCTGDSGERPHCGCPRQVAPVVEAALRKVMERNGLPERVVVDSNGAYWREYPDGEGLRYSMCPVSTDNDPIEPIAVYTFDRSAIPGPLALAVKYEVEAAPVGAEEED